MIFIDANIILETLLPGRKKVQEVTDAMSGESIVVSMLTVHIVYYFGIGGGIAPDHIHEVLSNYDIEDLSRDDYETAKRLLKNNDFEDALQLAVALRVGCSKIVTLDKQFARLYGDKMEFELP